VRISRCYRCREGKGHRLSGGQAEKTFVGFQQILVVLLLMYPLQLVDNIKFILIHLSK